MRGVGKVKSGEKGLGGFGVPRVGNQGFRGGQGHGHPAGEAGVVMVALVVDVLGRYSPAEVERSVGCVLAGGSDEEFVG